VTTGQGGYICGRSYKISPCHKWWQRWDIIPYCLLSQDWCCQSLRRATATWSIPALLEAEQDIL